jgi:hypothetical protein
MDSRSWQPPNLRRRIISSENPNNVFSIRIILVPQIPHVFFNARLKRTTYYTTFPILPAGNRTFKHVITPQSDLLVYLCARGLIETRVTQHIYRSIPDPKIYRCIRCMHQNFIIKLCTGIVTSPNPDPVFRQGLLTYASWDKVTPMG